MGTLHTITAGSPTLAHRPASGRKIEVFRSGRGADGHIENFGLGAKLAGGFTEAAGRREQQDAVLMGLSHTRQQLLLAVADGTQQDGELVSHETLNIMHRNFSGDQFSLADSAREANRWVRQKKGPLIYPWAGTTLTACLIDLSAKKLQVAHTGDSRAYLFRDGQLRLLTLDQTALPEYLEFMLGKDPDTRSPALKRLIDLMGTPDRTLGPGPLSPLLSELIHDVSNEYCRSEEFTDQSTELLGVNSQFKLGHLICKIKNNDWIFAFSDGVHSCCTYAELSRWIANHQKKGPYELSRAIKRMLTRNDRLSDNVTIAAYHHG